ncbi:hypothetical protein M0R45_019063 [Rubus argutus]|uniref:Uncharacterized protein n=1 Tax=Rubus argutus TaxID=59490 RepID=A0AAW1X6V8_RUBAR
MDSFTALPPCSPITMVAITDPLSAQPCSSSAVVPSDAAISHRPPRAHLGSKPAPPAQVGRRDIVWEWLWEWECRRI